MFESNLVVYGALPLAIGFSLYGALAFLTAARQSEARFLAQAIGTALALLILWAVGAAIGWALLWMVQP